MNIGHSNEVEGLHVALELELLAEYLDDHDDGHVPVNATSYQSTSQQIKALLQSHLYNPHVWTACNTSRSLREILFNLLVERKQEITVQLACALDELEGAPHSQH